MVGSCGVQLECFGFRCVVRSWADGMLGVGNGHGWITEGSEGRGDPTNALAEAALETSAQVTGGHCGGRERAEYSMSARY